MVERRFCIKMHMLQRLVRNLDGRALNGLPSRSEEGDEKEVVCVFCKKQIKGDAFVLPKCRQHTHKLCYEEEKLMWEFAAMYADCLFATIDLYAEHKEELEKEAEP